MRTGPRSTAPAAVIALASLLFAGSAAAADATVVVKPTALNGWAIVPDGTVPVTFEAGPASIGAGSLQFGPIDGGVPSNKFIMFAPVSGAVADLSAFSYDFFIDPASAGGAADADEFYLNVYVDSSANGIGTFGSWYDCRFDSVPALGAVDAWTTHAVTQASAWDNVASPLPGCPATLAAVPAGSEIMYVVLNGGQSTAADAGVAGGFDNVVVATPSGATTYDFEALVGPPTSKAACKAGGWRTFDLPRTFKNQGRCIQYVNTGKTGK